MSNISAVDESRIGTRRQYEIISGVAYMMAPPYYRHNRIGTNLCRIIGNYLLGKRCKLSYETMVYLDENNKFIPDLVVVCDKNKIKADGIHGAPDLVIEILSPSTKKRDIGIKKIVYEKFGVREYWIVSPKEKSVETYILNDGKFYLDEVYSTVISTLLSGICWMKMNAPIKNLR